MLNQGLYEFFTRKTPPEDLKDGRYISDTISINACTIAEQVDAKSHNDINSFWTMLIKFQYIGLQVKFVFSRAIAKY